MPETVEDFHYLKKGRHTNRIGIYCPNTPWYFQLESNVND